MDLRHHIIRQIVFSRATFGPGERTAGVIDHIRKELQEIEAAETQIERVGEWIDVIILGLDGLWRAIDALEGANDHQGDADQIALTAVVELVRKQRKNESRQWPDWRTSSPDKAIEHVRDAAPQG